MRQFFRSVPSVAGQPLVPINLLQLSAESIRAPSAIRCNSYLASQAGKKSM
jgi:hypothetical protein